MAGSWSAGDSQLERVSRRLSGPVLALLLFGYPRCLCLGRKFGRREHSIGRLMGYVTTMRTAHFLPFVATGHLTSDLGHVKCPSTTPASINPTH